ncbi:hypothetical protein A3SI_10879 [Nitritalea halalkaliphila LW7]|uniref:Uncharacterized protein n=1 Tax=Nitritalea halalkaliphila LW7 TaxID=1189621 RepID=I5C3A8_9BACT|nr:hypothetical protein [Nitritalea halalkaliphila]EIM76310.1 hypothetical protein A3SI_10879 [Nitritalea halalkaliphila LW7]
MQFSYQEGKEVVSIPFLPVYNQSGEVEALADETGTALLPVGEIFLIQSLFFRDTLFQVPNVTSSTFFLQVEDLALEAVHVTSFAQADSHVQALSQSMQKKYIQTPHLGTFTGYSLVTQKGQVLDFFEAAGLSLLSGNVKWKPWDFSTDNTSGSAYNRFVPMEQRRSFHWTLAGDTLPSKAVDYEDRTKSYVLTPFYAREIYRALEVSGPLDEKSSAYYAFKYGAEGEEGVIYFTIKDRLKADENLPVFLVGEGKIYPSSSGDRVEKVRFSFSSYRYINFELGRTLRNREMSGQLEVIYGHKENLIYPKEISLEAKFFGQLNLGRPRPFEPGEAVSISEKIYLEGYTPLEKEEAKVLNAAMGYIGLESMVAYAPAYWSLASTVPKEQFKKIAADLRRRLPLEQQFQENSGKRLHPFTQQEEMRGRNKKGKEGDFSAQFLAYIEKTMPVLRQLWIDAQKPSAEK